MTLQTLLTLPLALDNGLGRTPPLTFSVWNFFGLHANAKITFEKQESDKLLVTVTDIQPALGGGGGGESPEEVVSALAQQLLAQTPPMMDRKDAGGGVIEGEGDMPL